jgi:hypothetical protein
MISSISLMWTSKRYINHIELIFIYPYLFG